MTIVQENNISIVVKRRQSSHRIDFHIEGSDIRRERQKARDLRASQWWKRRLAKGRCHYCGRSFPPHELTMDHIVPVSRGGKTTKNNVAPCCKECNNKKKECLLMEWDQYLESVRNEQSDP